MGLSAWLQRQPRAFESEYFGVFLTAMAGCRSSCRAGQQRSRKSHQEKGYAVSPGAVFEAIVRRGIRLACAISPER